MSAKELIQKLTTRKSYTQPYLLWGVLAIVLVAAAGFLAAEFTIRAEHKQLAQEASSRVRLQASSRAETIQAWLENLRHTGDDIIQSDIVRLFATEVDIKGGNQLSLQAQLLNQLPYMRQVIQEFATTHGLNEALLINSRGHVYITSAAGEASPLSEQQKKLHQAALESGRSQVSTIRQEGPSLVMDIARLIMRPDGTQPAAVFLLTIPVQDEMPRLLRPSPFNKHGEKSYLVQMYGNHTHLVEPKGGVREILFAGTMPGALSAIRSPINNDMVFAAEARVQESPFIVYHEYPAALVSQPLSMFRSSILLATGLAVLLIAVLIMALIWFFLGQRNRHRVKMQDQIIGALLRSIEIRDPYLSGHHERLARVSLSVANLLKLPTRDRSTLYYSALLCGIGKIFIPQKILTKPGRLSEDERKVLESHITHTATILDDLKFDLPISATVRQMHERMDGSGYPERLSGEAISLLSRILGACDTYCALTAPRSYRARKQPEEALEIMKSEASKYDPRILEQLGRVSYEKAASEAV